MLGFSGQNCPNKLVSSEDLESLQLHTRRRACCVKQNFARLRLQYWSPKAEDPMKLKFAAGALAVIGALVLLVPPATAQTSQTKKRDVVYNRDRTVVVTRDEDGRTRTRIIIQKRSYLDPGTEVFPGERVGNTGYIENPNQRAGSVINNTSAGLLNTQSALPGPWTLPFKSNPWIGY